MSNLPVVKRYMVINTKINSIDIHEIQNRRFMYDPTTGILFLGKQYNEGCCHYNSHSEEFVRYAVPGCFDDYIRGWIGSSEEYIDGVIHFAPMINALDRNQYGAGILAIKMFLKNCANANTVIRHLGTYRERLIGEILQMKITA